MRHATALAIIVLVAGCSPTSNATKGPGGTGTLPPGASGGAGPGTVFHLATDLEARIPADAAGTALTIESVVGAGFQGSRLHHAGLRCRWYETRGLRCRDQKELDAVLASLGKSLQDVTIAVGYDRTRTRVIEVQALRIAGVGGQQILDAVVAVEGARAPATDGATMSVVQIGGRSVTVLRPGRPYPSGDRYRYASADVLYEIRKADQKTVEALVAKLS